MDKEIKKLLETEKQKLLKYIMDEVNSADEDWLDDAAKMVIKTILKNAGMK
jgi:hypothetical protein